MTETRQAAAERPEEIEAPDAPVVEDGGVEDRQEQPAEAPARPRRFTRIMWAVAVVAAFAGLAAAGVGFALSYGTLVDAAARWGYGSWEQRVFPLGVDGLIIALYSIDLVLVWRRHPKPMLRVAAHAVTAVTIGLNVIAAAEGVAAASGLWDAFLRDPGRLLGHAAMPAAYVLLTEAARHLISRTARLESGDTSALTLADWVMRFPTTWWVFRTAKTFPMPYAEAREMKREIEIHRVWLQYREEIEAARADAEANGATFDERDTVTVLDRLPELLAPYGVTPDEALALPDRMRQQEQDRRAAQDREEQNRRHRAEADRREREHAEKLARLAAEADEIRAQGEIDSLRATVEGESKAAAYRASAAADTAGIEASAQRSRAERAATEEQRRLDAEEQAEESAKTAALRRKTAEDDNAAARVEQESARRREETAARNLNASRAEAEAKRLADEAAEAEARTAGWEKDTAQQRAEAAALNLRASLAEEAAGLSDRERQERRVARMILAEAGGDPAKMPTTVIEQRLGVVNSTATGYRDGAGRLLASGYNPATDPIHTVNQEIAR
ncbi:DUF2637 domain-containing protein [Streptomyces sp. NPDC046988]|uniref:DUF2637 domain-containing protein n=1 Tax=Streptomyces sp. NPDC046988 TaxID=3154922 RepID=UPI0033CBFDD7